MKKIFLFIVTLVCMCSCYKATILDDGRLKWGYYSDVYIPNDSITYYMNCKVLDFHAEFQCSERKRIKTSVDTVLTSFGNYIRTHDTVTVKTMNSTMLAKEFRETLRLLRDEDDGGPTIDIGNGVFITRKLFNEIYSNYIPN